VVGNPPLIKSSEVKSSDGEVIYTEFELKITKINSRGAKRQIKTFPF